MSDCEESFGQRLRRLRETRRQGPRDRLWSAAGFARQLDISPPLLWVWEHDRKPAPARRLARMAMLLNCSEHYLQYGEEHPAEAALEDLRETVRQYLEPNAPQERTRLFRELQVKVRA